MTIKKSILLISVFLITGMVSGQTAFDYLVKAKALTASGNPDQAIGVLTSAIEKQEGSKLYSARAEAFLIKGDYGSAISDYNAANRLLENSGEYGLSRVYALKGDAGTSLYHLERSMKSSFKKDEKEILPDPAFSRIENRTEWRNFWKNEWYTAPEKCLSEIEYYVSSGNSEEAQRIIRDMDRDYPGSEKIQFAKALMNLSAGKYNDVIRTISALLTTDPDNEKYLRTIAKAQTGASNPAGASFTYSKLINLEIPDAQLLLDRALCFRKTGENDKALDDIKKYLSVYPGDEAALSLAGRTEAASGDNLKALEYFSENLKLHPENALCYAERANSYLMSKSWTWAIKDYTMSLDLDPYNSEVWLNKGIALIRSGNINDGCHDLKRSLSLGNIRATENISRYCIK
ncbi:MAG: tetratricopeptide repeat protein [Bacteroidales bacterium]|jgi:tetratricopeptide (TPR) repeat protein|nr:tetratricopeptide repeat protein [Bacteroidales bacterium]